MSVVSVKRNASVNGPSLHGVLCLSLYFTYFLFGWSQGNTGATIFAFCAFVLWEITPLFAVTFFFRHIPKSRPTQKGVRRPLLSPDPSVPGGEERGFFPKSQPIR
eukprot:Opistho-2@13714